jgi:holo-[acyl-carrier protein] synthase
MIGIDIEETKRFKLKRTSAFIKKTFSASEISYAYSRTKPHLHLCGMFCAKEAYCKASAKKLDPLKIELGHEKSGKPYLLTNGKKNSDFELSISHCDTYAVAIVMRISK